MDMNEVRFSDESTGYNLVRWQWTFGDGATSEEQNPAHSYMALGAYQVTLKITDSDDVTTTNAKVVSIEELAPSQVDFTLVCIVLVVLGLIATAVARNNPTRVGAAVIVVLGLLLWVRTAGVI
jgi:hypothetical protein